MTKYLLTYKMWWRIILCIVLYNFLYKINNFLLIKVKTIFILLKPINKEKNLYINVPKKKNLFNINKKISDKSKTIKIPNVKHITSKTKYITSNQLRLEI